LTPSSSRKSKSAFKNKATGEDSGEDESGIRGSFATRADADQFLIKSRESGMTYKDIRLKGGFTEAESTLRGRWRTLTKSREERVRRPEWSATDVRLLEVAVRMMARPAAGAYSRNAPKQVVTEEEWKTAKIPWKQVAEHIVQNGGTYHFGNTTCRKRWEKLYAEQRGIAYVEEKRRKGPERKRREGIKREE
jgi:hypothetical protein